MEDGSTGLMSAAGQGASYGTVSTGTPTGVDESIDVGAAAEERRGAEPAAAAGRSTGEKAAIALCVLAVFGALVFFAGKQIPPLLESLSTFVIEHHTAGVALCIGVFLPWIVLCLPTTLYEILIGFMVRRRHPSTPGAAARA